MSGPVETASSRRGDRQLEEMRGGDALARQLAREGVADVFGVPGVQLDVAIDGLARLAARLRFWNTRHEQGAAYMADGYARSTGKTGVCLVVPGPGMLNATAALSTAYACSSPVVCVVGQIPSAMIGRGLGLLHEVNEQSATLSTVTKWRETATTPAEIPGLVQTAMQVAKSGRPRPVAVEVPPDVLEAQEDVELLGSAPPAERIVPDAATVARAGAILSAARSPVIYAGGGVSAAGAWRELRALAEHNQAPVVMSVHGRDALDNRHPLALTSLAGREVLPHADVVLVVGSRFLTGVGEPVATAPGAKVILLNADAGDLGGPRVSELRLHADATLGLAALREETAKTTDRNGSEVVSAARARADRQIEPLQPQLSWVRALRSAIPEDGILVNELTQVGYLAEVAYPVYGPRTYVTPGYQGTLGYGFATAIGAKVGNPDRTVVSINGDGGFGWNLTELATIKKYELGVVTVVFNDNAFGNVRRTQRRRYDARFLGTDLVNPDFLKLADAYGIRGERVTTPDGLTSAIRAASGAREPVLIEVPVEEMPSPWHLIHDFIPRPAAPAGSTGT